MTIKGVNFAAQVDAWTRETNDRMTQVFRASAQEVIGEMQKPVANGGNMPIDTGFLRASLQVSTKGPASMIDANPYSPTPGIQGARDPDMATVKYDANVASMTIATTKIGETIWATYTANYAAHQEYGANGRAPRGFVRSAAAQWPTIVNRVVAQAKTNAR